MTETFIVQAPDNWFLRGTTFTGDIGLATKFATRDAATAAIVRAAKFSKPKIVKTWTIREV